MANEPSIVIKKVRKVGHAGHHGGAWKVAYADFVTAMMAFFLLLWLLNVTTDEQRNGIADYFAPSSVSRTTSGSGGVLGGLSAANEGAMASGGPTVIRSIAPAAQPTKVIEEKGVEKGGEGDARKEADPTPDELETYLAEREELAFKEAEDELKRALETLPNLEELQDQLIIDRTPEGLRIQIVDNYNRSMFESGSAALRPRTRELLVNVAKVVDKLPNRLSISGHTDAEPFVGDRPDYTNWELSSDRANASRRVLLDAGISAERILRVSGRSDTEPLFPEDAYAPQNRRVTIVLLREAPVLPPSYR